MVKLLSQVLLAGIFMKGGVDAFVQPDGKVKLVAEASLPAGLPNPRTAVELDGVVMMVGGTMLALNIAPRLAAAGLMCSLLPATVVGHAFWKEEDEATRQAQQIQFLKNLGLLGGLLLILTGK